VICRKDLSFRRKKGQSLSQRGQKKGGPTYPSRRGPGDIGLEKLQISSPAEREGETKKKFGGRAVKSPVLNYLKAQSGGSSKRGYIPV